MELTNEEVEEFRQIWREEFKEEIAVEDARQRARELIELYMLFARHMGKRNGKGESSGSTT